MTKRWSEVEISEQYKALTPRDQFRAKKEYWDTVVSPKPEYVSLPSDFQKSAKKEFFGGILREDIPAISSVGATYKTIGDTIVGTDRVFSESLGKLGSSYYQLVRHPVQSVKSIGTLLSGIFQKIIPGHQPNEDVIDAIAQDYMKSYGSIDAIADTVATDPFRFVTDVYMAGGLASGALKTTGKLTGVKAISEAGSFKYTADTIKKMAPVRSAEDKVYQAYSKIFPNKSKGSKGILARKETVVGRVQAWSKNLPEDGLINNMTNETFKTPRNEYEILIAHQHAKKSIWDKATSLSKGATDKGVKIDMGKLAAKAAKETIDEYGDYAVKTSLSDNANVILKEAAKHKGLTTSPKGAQDYLKTMTDSVIKQRKAGVMVDYSITDFNTRFYKKIVDATDEAITQSLHKADYPYLRKQYAQIVSGESEINASANKFLIRQSGGLKGVAHPIVNLFSIESIVSGVLTGQSSQGIMRAGFLQAAKGIYDWTRNPSRHVKGMFKNASKLKPAENIPVLNPEILFNHEPLLLPSPKVKLKRIGTTSTGKGTIIPENQIKRLPPSETIYGEGFTATKPINKRIIKRK